MKPMIPIRWSLIGTKIRICLPLLLLFGLPMQAAWAVLAGSTSATLSELLIPGTILRSSDGSVEFDQFSLEVSLPKTNAPDPTEIILDVITPNGSDKTVLQFRIIGASQIIPYDEAYELEIEYQVHLRTEDLVFAEVSLDIDGATLGTIGTGLVQFLATLTPQESLQQAPLSTSVPAVATAQLEVIDDGDGVQRLFDSVSIPPGQQSLQLTTTVEVRGGGDSSSGAVLTDFQFGFLRRQAIPEPSSLLLATLAFFMWPIGACRRTRRLPLV